MGEGIIQISYQTNALFGFMQKANAAPPGSEAGFPQEFHKFHHHHHLGEWEGGDKRRQRKCVPHTWARP